MNNDISTWHYGLLIDFVTDSTIPIVVQAANEKSFKLLQEYLAAAEEQSYGGGGAGSLAYKFTFYVKQHIHHAAGGTETPFHKVSLTLPPPVRSQKN